MRLSTKEKTGSKVAGDITPPPSVDLKQQIEMHAYYKAEARGFAPGGDFDDWLAAEAEINSSAKVH